MRRLIFLFTDTSLVTLDGRGKLKQCLDAFGRNHLHVRQSGDSGMICVWYYWWFSGSQWWVSDRIKMIARIFSEGYYFFVRHTRRHQSWKSQKLSRKEFSFFLCTTILWIQMFIWFLCQRHQLVYWTITSAQTCGAFSRGRFTLADGSLSVILVQFYSGSCASRIIFFLNVSKSMDGWLQKLVSKRGTYSLR